MDRRFMALRIIATVFRILAWLALIFGVLGAIGALLLGFTLSGQEGLLGLNVTGPLAGIAMFVVSLIVAIIGFLLLYACAEFIYLFLSIEENTRRTAYLVQQQYAAQQPVYAPTSSPSEYDKP
jgi:predicted lipid-binding transport protein (Tim44 family)